MTAVRIGGLFGCCVATAAASIDAYEGEELTCPYCDERMRFVQGAWEWFPSSANYCPLEGECDEGDY